MGTKSEALFQKAKKLIPGGVNSPVRAGKAVGMDPPFISRAKGCFLWDVDGKRYIDYVCSWGPMILGHSHPSVVRALEGRISKGTSYGAPTRLEVEMAEDHCGDGSLHRDGENGEFRHGSHHERNPACKRVHGQIENHQIRRLLSWSRRQSPRLRRFGRRHFRNPGVPRCSGGLLQDTRSLFPLTILQPFPEPWRRSGPTSQPSSLNPFQGTWV